MKSTSLTDVAYKNIKEKLIKATYMPGYLLSENELAKELGMSRTPIRGAISRLESEGYLTSLNNRGILVKEITLKEALDLGQIIVMFQEYSVDSVLHSGASYNIEDLKMYLELQMETEKNDQYFDYLRYNMLFVRSMISIIDNATILEILESLKCKFIRGGMIHKKITPYQKHYSLIQTNKSIYDAICAGNYHEIKRLCRDTIRLSREKLLFNG
ncbi:MAG TPA: GntR family transcriptional regulator [Bacillus bacterium]|nr:GntR family transcriptional regulator [Bacillus sp. (in: firmicutes)]